MFSQRRLDFGRYYVAKLFTLAGLQSLAKNPASIYRHAKSFLFDVNLEDESVAEALTIYQDALTTLAQFENRQTAQLDQWLPVIEHPSIKDLSDLFIKNGSDKSALHDYHLVYGSILSAKRHQEINILEVGLGTNNLDIPSNMGALGKPGASLRAFRDWAPHANIYGADVDRRILFNEKRISTYWVDQTDKESLRKLADSLHGIRFDLIIDDGLHLPHAAINMLDAILPLLADDGVYVVEDIYGYSPFWNVAELIISKNYATCFSQRPNSSIFVVRRKPGP